MDTRRRPSDLADELGRPYPFANRAQEAALNIARTNAALSSQAEHLFQEHGISAQQYDALRILSDEGKPLLVYQIAERMVSPQTDITRLVDFLERSGFVARKRCGDNRRAVCVSLRAAGKAIVKILDRSFGDLRDRQFGHLSGGELKSLNALLFRIRNPE